jgi:trehalose-6-phosphatase
MNEFSGRPNAAKVQLNELVDQQGKPASPTLPGEIKNYLIDIDGTITEDVPNEDPERMATCLPFPDALQTLNRWHADGHIITFFTSRTEEHRAVTEAWFDKHGFLYHGLLMGKPRGGNYHWVDNHIVRATRYEGTFSDLVREQAEIEVFKKG